MEKERAILMKKWMGQSSDAWALIITCLSWSFWSLVGLILLVSLIGLYLHVSDVNFLTIRERWWGVEARGTISLAS